MTLTSARILCVGAALMDHVGAAALEAGQSAPGVVRTRPGGVAFNIATSLAAGGADVRLIAAVGDDAGGQALSAALKAQGVENGLIIGDEPTGAYLALEDATGEMAMAVNDARAAEALSEAAILNALNPADALIIDANLTPQQINAALTADVSFKAAEAVSAAKAPRLLGAALDAIFCNRAEANAMTGEAAKDALSAARLLSETMGARAFVTDGPALAAAVFGDEIAVAQPESIVGSVTGAGDVFTAAALLALLRSAPLGEALADGVEASAARIRTAS